MSTSIACSNVKGWSEIGFAFGIAVPPWASRVARSWADISSEHASAAACSAFCDHVRKDVGILPIIMSVRKLREVQRQIVFAHMVKRADHAAL